MRVLFLVLLSVVFSPLILKGVFAWNDTMSFTATAFSEKISDSSFRIDMQLYVNGTDIEMTWSSNFDIDSYTLFFAPFPYLSPIFSIPIGKIETLKAELPMGSSYYVAIGAKNPYGEMIFSNVEYFRIVPIWSPLPGTTWQWQLTGPIDMDVNATMFDLDLFNVSSETINKLHRENRIVICYFSAGTYEPWREDSDLFPLSVIGNPLNNWPDERWLDIRARDIIGPIMERRLDLAVEKGCDGVEPDNVDGYENNTGFDISYEDQLDYNKYLAMEAHKRGLSIGLKNDLEQIEDLEPYFDWALNEECFTYNECYKLLPFVHAGKAVFGVEYDMDPENFCPLASRMGFSFLKKRPSLDAWFFPCYELYQ